MSQTHCHPFEMSANDLNWSFYLDRTVHPKHLDFQRPGVSPKIPKSNDSRQNHDINPICGHARAYLIRVTFKWALYVTGYKATTTRDQL
ncbi:hypothetical protein CEXT_487691 [Caerostris extrusa]|uniref:Uncharacterized protein n=1 Tax=Caerostris extrusa TaxID=172846 RepID=A0AAV4Q7I3_CAEEX|nr:hypothetical protein CEXT_487691 [Caerostris extrusa]